MGVVPMNAAPRRRISARLSLALSLVVFLAAALILPWIGAGPISFVHVLHRQSPDYEILLQLRLSRTLLALIAGGALSLAGALFQAMLRDALATPYTLGISAGASCGAVAAILLGWETFLGIPTTWIGSLIGAFAVLVLVIGGAFRQRQVSSFGLLLTGIAINSICEAFILILSSFAGVSRSFSIARWLIGSVDSVSYTSLAMLAAVVLIASGILFSRARSWNLLAVSERWAASRGVNVGSLLAQGYILGSILVAGAIALTGPIGFVGLIVPHLVRSRISPDHRLLMPCSFLLGGALLALCDAIGRIVMPPAELPAGAVVALIGGPYLVWIIRQRTPAEEL
ncbi:FecCD family ABC transporter permease [Silvibacterium dinghuense]|uniref:Iron ABC transporter permease n=1 Tax=Silvibacterium dinghuense TaxID=1560006 RepID=A0A4Q1SJ67_9BACT|nr:iron ABC transporter permease [Silvibacterium dinghuense]RXS97666.1 iron ABC transporter permease [Silvibacterium dinghuense]GGH00958.1 ABC transporter permease [Silvibacterium dinghuense]